MKSIYFSKKNKYVLLKTQRTYRSRYLSGERVGLVNIQICSIFHPVKIVAGGEGGVVTTNSKKPISNYLSTEAMK